MSSKKTTFRKRTSLKDRRVPLSLADLPRYSVTPSSSVSRELSGRQDIAFRVRSLDDLVKETNSGFADPARRRK
jgi:pyocin large subunit-like protein